MITDTVLMIRPVRFGFNEETAGSNAFQRTIKEFTNDQIQEIALLEFDNFKKILENAGVNVIEYVDTRYPYTPDSIFPNNWISTDPEGRLITYPMMTKNRRDERRKDIIDYLIERYNYKHIGLEKYEHESRYLEGTGSLVLDHKNEIAYSAISPRTDIKVLEEFSKVTGYEVFKFTARGPSGEFVYHTNVVMCACDEFVILAEEAVDYIERNELKTKLSERGKTIINIDFNQYSKCFAGNMLQLKNNRNEKLLIMSSTASRSLNESQRALINSFQNKIVAVPINIIEAVGGGSARCMLAEIFH